METFWAVVFVVFILCLILSDHNSRGCVVVAFMAICLVGALVMAFMLRGQYQ